MSCAGPFYWHMPARVLCVLSLERCANMCRAASLFCMARRWLPPRCTSSRTTTRRGSDVQSASMRPCSSASPGGCAQAPAGCTCWQPKNFFRSVYLVRALAVRSACMLHCSLSSPGGSAQVSAGCTDNRSVLLQTVLAWSVMAGQSASTPPCSGGRVHGFQTSCHVEEVSSTTARTGSWMALCMPCAPQQILAQMAGRSRFWCPCEHVMLICWVF